VTLEEMILNSNMLGPRSHLFNGGGGRNGPIIVLKNCGLDD
jgi:hypothetical protein